MGIARTVRHYTPPARERFLASDGRLRRFHVFRERQLGGQGEREPRPAAAFRELDPTVHHACELARDREPEPAPGCPGAVEPEEPLEYLLAHLEGDPRAVVGNGQEGPVTVQRRREPHPR